jgi:nucleoid-associated protein YgaU
MAISRLGRAAVAVSGLAALAAAVIWFGILKRDGPPGSALREAAAPRAPADAPAASRQAAPTSGQAESQVARLPDRAGTPSTSAPHAAVPSPAPVPPADAQPTTPPRSSAIPPSFDIVRVEPSGESVIAGRTAPGATVELLRNGKSHARIASDASGLFAFVPPPFPPGSHEVVLQSTAPDGTRTQSRESVTIVIAEKKNAKPLVALATPDRPTVVLSEPEPPAATSQPRPGSPEPQAQTAAAPDAAKVERPEPPAPASPSLSAVAPPSSPPSTPAPQPGTASASAGAPAALPSAAAPPGAASPPAPPVPAAPRPRSNIRIASVEADEGGRLFVSGQAAPGATVRLYLNDTMIAPGGAGADGRVSFAIGRGMRPGSYRVRLDDVDPVSGEVKSRAEVEFRVPAPVTVELPPAAPPYVTRSTDAEPPGRVAAAPPFELPGARSSAAVSAPNGTPSSSPAQDTVRPQRRSASGPPPGHGIPGQPPAPTAGRPSIAAPTGPADGAPASARVARAPDGSAGVPATPSTTASAVQRQLDANTVMIPEVNTAIVSRGENLWSISRRVYGRGVRYTVIYNANEEQIRNPNLIYPGQVFVLPAENADGAAR